MIKNILGTDFKYEEDKMYRLHKQSKKWICCNDNKPSPIYINAKVNKKFYYLHRLIFKYHNDDWDITDISKNNRIDHIDINKLNNTIENLRVVDNKN